jgi:hypothetical protein
LIIETDGKCHEITCRVDPIAQRPIVQHAATARTTTGTTTRIEWTPGKPTKHGIPWPFDGATNVRSGPLAEHCRHIIAGTAVFNPHATLRLQWFGQETTWQATNAAWQKWKPNRPTSTHW